MTAQKQIVRMRDFSGGEMVEHAKRRDDEAVVRSACRTARNVRILSSGALERRHGRSAIFRSARAEDVRMSSTATYRLCFDNTSLIIRDDDGTVVDTETGYSWTSGTLDQIVWTQIDNDIVITYPGQIPKIARWDGASAWTFLDWAALTTSGGQKRVPFYRISPKSITMLPAARTGTAVAVTFSSGMNLVAGHVGTRMRFVNRQVTIASRLTATTGTIDINEPLPGSQVLTFGSDPRTVFSLAEVVNGATTNSVGYITALSATQMTLQLLSLASEDTSPGKGVGSAGFTTESVVGPGGALTATVAAAIGNPVAVPIWDEEVFNSHQGWPRSCNVDQNRLIFTDFPAVPHGIAWSATLTPDDFYPAALATDAIFETVPKKARVYHVVGGADEFVITDRGVYYIPISEANPLRPGSVAFRRIPGPSGSAVRPVETAQGTLYVNAGLNRVLAIVGTGQTAFPWIIKPVSDLHDLFSGVKCLALEEGDGSPPVEHVYAVNADGTVAVGRYQPGKEWVGWVLWTGEGVVKWVGALGADVLFTVVYGALDGLVERMDSTQWLDAAATYNAVPAPLAPGVGQDVLWYLAEETLKVMSGRRYIGDRVIDADGAVTLLPGDSFTTQVFGQGFDVTIEPFLAHVQGGQSVGQTLHPRQISNGAVAVQNSTGFRIETWRPSDETWVTLKDWPAYRGGENEDDEPALREEAVTFPSVGADHDPRIRIVKDFPGPLRVIEIDVEIGA